MDEVDITGLVVIGTIAALIAALGAGVDKLATPGQKNRLSSLLATWWITLDDLSLAKFSDFGFASILDLKERVFGSKFVGRSLLLSVIALSVVATTTIVLWGDYRWFKNLQETIEYFPNQKPVFLFSMNILLDVLTVLTTLHILAVALNHGIVLRLVLVGLDIVFAIILSLMSLHVTMALEFWNTGNQAFGAHGVRLDVMKSATQLYFSYWAETGVISWDWSVLKWITDSSNGWIGPYLPGVSGGEWGVFVSSLTTVVPTLCYLLMLALVLSSLLTLKVIQAIAMQLFSLDVETDKSVFFYTGTFIGVVGVVIKLVVEAQKII